MITQAPIQHQPLPSLRQLKLLPIRAAIDRVIRSATVFAQGEEAPVGWREVKRAVIYAADANSESVAIAAQHLASAVANAQLLESKPERSQFVLRQVHQAIETAFDACFQDEFADLTRGDFFRLKRSSKQHRFPRLGPELDVTSNGGLGPVWPIWSDPIALRSSRSQ